MIYVVLYIYIILYLWFIPWRTQSESLPHHARLKLFNTKCCAQNVVLQCAFNGICQKSGSTVVYIFSKGSPVRPPRISKMMCLTLSKSIFFLPKIEKTELQNRMTKRSLPSRWPRSLCTLPEVHHFANPLLPPPKCALLWERTISPFFTCAVMQVICKLYASYAFDPSSRKFFTWKQRVTIPAIAKLQFWKVAFRVTSLELRTAK